MTFVKPVLLEPFNAATSQTDRCLCHKQITHTYHINLVHLIEILSLLACRCWTKMENKNVEGSSTASSALYPPPPPSWSCFSGVRQTGGSPFTHSGSSDSQEAQTDGGKNKQVRLNFVNVHLLQPEWPLSSFLVPNFAFLLCLSTSLPPSSVFCSVLCHLDVRFNSVTYGVPRGISPCLHLPIWICVTMYVYV